MDVTKRFLMVALVSCCVFLSAESSRKCQGGEEKDAEIAVVDAEIQTIKVSTAHEFLEALGSNRIIEIAPGEYNLSEWDPFRRDQANGEDLSNPGEAEEPKLPEGVSWEETHDGGELILRGIEKLTIRGAGKTDGSELIVDPRYAFVLKFENCNDIEIQGLSAGHSGGGFCQGGVFGFANSSRIAITDTGMYGCGTEGLTLSDVSGMKVTASRIYDCAFYIMTVSGGKDISFEKCVFSDNQEFTLVNVSKTGNMSFANCEFTGNSGEMFNVRDAIVSVSNSSFSNNDTQTPIASSRNVEFTGCTIDPE